MSVDIKGFSGLPHGRQERLQLALARVLDAAAETAGVDRERWDRRGDGDGEVAVLPGDTDLALMVGPWTAALNRRLADHNDDHLPEMRLRLRVAMHVDAIRPDPGPLGHTGPALITLARLLDSTPLRAALDAAPEANLALMISEPLYRKTALAEVDGLRPWQFERVRVDNKEFHENAYVHVPPAMRPPKPPKSLKPPKPSRPPASDRRGPLDWVVPKGSADSGRVRLDMAPPPEPEPVPAPPVPEPPVLAPEVRHLLDGIRDALEAREIVRADLLTTRVLLRAAERERQGCLRVADGTGLPDALFTEIDDHWAEASGGRWGFAAQRLGSTDVALSGRRGELRRLSVLFGWLKDVDEIVPEYAELMLRENRDRPFFPTLRNPEAETRTNWDDEWTSTALSVHVRLRNWER
ncbi:GUN4 domain-containing protein [Thermomonospora umbrina]|uniref:GUN4 domain-containing protein n=1 Tax=Thermomonospora umbrina TaxID=111806 RepID=UPI0011C199E8|nr:GUN4 domain-containing protein [Thermomonospora umbrina]